MKIYDLVKNILEENEMARNSDRILIWEAYKKLRLVDTMDCEVYGSNETKAEEIICRHTFVNSKIPSMESITRARRKIQELHPELEATNNAVRTRRRQKQKSKGTFIFREIYK